MPDFLTRRNGTWHYVRRVPLEFAAFDRRDVIRPRRRCGSSLIEQDAGPLKSRTGSMPSWRPIGISFSATRPKTRQGATMTPGAAPGHWGLTMPTAAKSYFSPWKSA
jgi:hypothetical protein